MKYFTILAISIVILSSIGCSLLEQTIDEIPVPTRPATVAPSGEIAVSPTAISQSQADPDSSIPQEQQPTAAPVDQPTDVLAPTGSDTPSLTAAPANPSTPDTTVSEATPIPVVELEHKNPADPSTPDTTVAEATPTPVAEPEPKNPADFSTPDTTVPEATPTPVVAPEAEAPAVPRQLTNSPGDELDPAWDPRGSTIAYMATKQPST